MLNTFTYLMEAYFYQDWQAEYCDYKVNDIDGIARFASKENVDLLNSLVQELEYISANDLAKKVFENNSFDFDPLLNGYVSEQEWVESAYKTLIAEIR